MFVGSPNSASFGVGSARLVVIQIYMPVHSRIGFGSDSVLMLISSLVAWFVYYCLLSVVCIHHSTAVVPFNPNPLVA